LNLSKPTNSILDTMKTNLSKVVYFEYKEKKYYKHYKYYTTMSKHKKVSLSTKHIINSNVLFINPKTIGLFSYLYTKYKQK